MKVRIGIDVGGTFTDAVAIDCETYELVGKVKIPTTHSAKEGVAAGIVQVLQKVMAECNIKPEDVVFIAHGTTQATNALLEGDVAQVGIVTLGSGIEGAKAKADSDMGAIPLADGKKFIKPINAFVNTGNRKDFVKDVEKAIVDLAAQGAASMVATEAFSVDNPENENLVVEESLKKGFPATAGSDVTKLYGLKVRTRTAVVNASILPKMLDAATMTDESIRKANITSPLMIMRCDGGVMTVDEVRKRPILTILSGPAAGVAGALMYEKLTDGIFLEVGGTSTDISCVRDGSVMVKYAEVGGHKTYLNSLDVRTVGIGGGSMIEIKDGKAVNVGPRSAHIAGLEYECYQKPEDIVNPVLKTVRPTDTDPEYAYIECSNGKKFALTQSGAANLAGYVPEGDYARGNVEATRKAWEPLAKNMGVTPEKAAEMCLGFANAKNAAVVNALIADYGLDKKSLVMVGGGGGASSVVPHLAKMMGVQCKIARNAPVISPIGVALAMVRDMVERTIQKPTEEDILALRREVVEKAIKSGAKEETIDVKIEVDSKTSRVRAIAVGATEMRSKTLGGERKSNDELRQIVAKNLQVPKENVQVAAENDSYAVITSTIKHRKFLFFSTKTHAFRVVDREGVIRLQRRHGGVHKGKIKNLEKHLEYMIDQFAVYGDGGEEFPNLWMICKSRIIDMSGLGSKAQVNALAKTELAGIDPETEVIFLATKTVDNARS